MKATILTVMAGSLLLGVLALGTTALAHNAGQVQLPTGECVSVGAGNAVVLPDGSEAPQIVESGETHLDLIEGSGDQFGARYAANQGDTPIEPRHCPP